MIFNRTSQYVAYENDVLTLGWLVRAIEDVTQLKEAVFSTELLISERKAKYMKVNKNIMNLEQGMVIDGQVGEGVQNFRYLVLW